MNNNWIEITRSSLISSLSRDKDNLFCIDFKHIDLYDMSDIQNIADRLNLYPRFQIFEFPDHGLSVHGYVPLCTIYDVIFFGYKKLIHSIKIEDYAYLAPLESLLAKAIGYKEQNGLLYFQLEEEDISFIFYPEDNSFRINDNAVHLNSKYRYGRNYDFIYEETEGQIDLIFSLDFRGFQYSFVFSMDKEESRKFLYSKDLLDSHKTEFLPYNHIAQKSPWSTRTKDLPYSHGIDFFSNNSIDLKINSLTAYTDNLDFNEIGFRIG